MVGGVKWDVVRLRLKIFGNIVHVEPHVHVLAPLDPYIGKSTDTPELSPSSNSPTSPTQTPPPLLLQLPPLSAPRDAAQEAQIQARREPG